MAARWHPDGETLPTLDRRAQGTYRRLGVRFEAIGD